MRLVQVYEGDGDDPNVLYLVRRWDPGKGHLRYYAGVVTDFNGTSPLWTTDQKSAKRLSRSEAADTIERMRGRGQTYDMVRAWG